MMKVKVSLNHRYAFFEGISDAMKEKLREYWSFFPPGYHFSPKYNRFITEPDGTTHRLWDGRISLLSRGRLNAGLFRATWAQAELDLQIRFVVTDDTSQELLDIHFARGFNSGEGKYDYQDTCVHNMVENVKTGGGLVLSATGTGKTKIAAQFFSKIPTKLPCLFVVDQVQLLYQSQEEIASWLKEDVGVVGDSVFTPQRVTVATIQTLHKHAARKDFKKWMQKLRIVIIDELHEQMARRNFKVIHTINPYAIFGLTATLQIKKKEVRYKAYALAGPVIYEFPAQEGIKRKVLTNACVLNLQFPYNGVPVEDDYQYEYNEQVADNELKLKTFVALSNQLITNHNKYIIGLVNRVAHIKRLAKLTRQSGMRRRLAYGGIDKKVRVETTESMDAGDEHLILANNVFKKGINIKRVDVIADMAEMKNKNDAMQKLGRGLRLHTDKTVLAYINFSTAKIPNPEKAGRKNRFYKSSGSRLRAFRAAGFAVKTVKVTSTEQAVKATEKWLLGIQKQQLKLEIK